MSRKEQCSGCTRSKDEHLGDSSVENWSDRECTIYMTTDAYGEKRFSVTNNRKSKVFYLNEFASQSLILFIKSIFESQIQLNQQNLFSICIATRLAGVLRCQS